MKNAFFPRAPQNADRKNNSAAPPPQGTVKPRKDTQKVLLSQNNADQAAAALVDDPLDGFLHPHARILRHSGQLGMQSLIDQLMQTLSEDI